MSPTPKMSALERAFEIARSGHARGLEDIRSALKSEGYRADQLEGKQLSKQLREIIKHAREDLSRPQQ